MLIFFLFIYSFDTVEFLVDILSEDFYYAIWEELANFILLIPHLISCCLMISVICMIRALGKKSPDLLTPDIKILILHGLVLFCVILSLTVSFVYDTKQIFYHDRKCDPSIPEYECQYAFERFYKNAILAKGIATLSYGVQQFILMYFFLNYGVKKIRLPSKVSSQEVNGTEEKSSVHSQEQDQDLLN